MKKTIEKTADGREIVVMTGPWEPAAIGDVNDALENMARQQVSPEVAEQMKRTGGCRGCGK